MVAGAGATQLLKTGIEDGKLTSAEERSGEMVETAVAVRSTAFANGVFFGPPSASEMVPAGGWGPKS